MKKYIIASIMILLLLTVPSISAIEYQQVTREYKSVLKEKNFEYNLYSKIFSSNNRQSILGRIIEFIRGNSNFSSFNLIMALIGTIAFFVLIQPMFLQAIVETGNDFIFIGLILSLILIEIFQKFFALKVLGLWEPYIINDVDGFWNFFSIVFFSIYFKIYFSYLPTFIIQYSSVFVKAFFYIIMFLLPILFNFCIADSIDLIDWNGDETPSAN